MLNVFIGYDPRESSAWHVLGHSIHKYASQPVRITPLKLDELEGEMWRDRHSLQSTEFSFSRFLVPYLMDYKGWALFLDCDMMVRADIAELFELADDQFSVMVTKHNYTPISETKMIGIVEPGVPIPQSPYKKKNWSSVMLFNCEKCRKLTLPYVNNASGLELHQFKWLKNDSFIGSLPLEWNWLVDESNYHYNPDAKNVHWTLGGPYLDAYFNCDYSEEWRAYLEEMLADRNDKGAIRLWG